MSNAWAETSAAAHRRLIYGDDDVPERDGTVRAPNSGAETSSCSAGICRDPEDEHAASDPERARLREI
jgi:hypothetical protein